MGCNCNKNKTQYEVVDANGQRVLGPTPFRTTAEAMAARETGRTVRVIEKGN